MIKSVLLLLASGLLHELGHYVAFRFYGVKPSFSFKLGWVTVGSALQTLSLTPAQNIIVLSAGVVAGTIPFFFGVPSWALLVYAGLCLGDVGLLSVFLQFPLEHWRKPSAEYVKTIVGDSGDS